MSRKLSPWPNLMVLSSYMRNLPRSWLLNSLSPQSFPNPVFPAYILPPYPYTLVFSNSSDDEGSLAQVTSSYFLYVYLVGGTRGGVLRYQPTHSIDENCVTNFVLGFLSITAKRKGEPLFS